MFGSPGGLGLAPITLVLFIAFAQSPCSVVTIAPLTGREARKDVGCPLHGAIRVKVGYSGSNKMISACGSQWLVVHGCMCLTDVWGLQELAGGSSAVDQKHQFVLPSTSSGRPLNTCWGGYVSASTGQMVRAEGKAPT